MSPSSGTLERRLGLAAVVAISISAMLGSGIFVLPGLAAAKTGPLVWLAYLVAGLTVLPAALSKAELATAMPTSGGTYVYLERTFGPLAGTISGLGLWLSLLLKSAFALVGFGAYLSVLVGMEMTKYNLSVVALILLVAITILNIMGVGIISKMQKFILSGVLLALLALSIKGLGTMRPEYLEEGMTKGFSGFLAATAFVYVSYAGVTKVAAIAEEVKNPERNLPWGILISWFTVMSIYVFVVYVLVANVSQDQLTHSGMGKEGPPDLHPIYTLANIVAGPVAGTVAAVLAVITMVSMAVAGLLAASRFPFAMSRDSLLPKVIKNISPKFKTPLPAILLTAFVMAFSILFLPIEKIAKLASAFMILAYMLECGTVLVLRESASRWYQPGFRSPFYPGMQILGIVFGLILLYALGLTSVFAIGCIVIVGAILYFSYGRFQTSRRGEMGKMGPRRDLLAGNSTYKEGAAPVIQEASSKAAVVVPLFGSERSPETLVEMGASLAHGRRLEVLHLTVLQEETNDEDVPDAEPRTHAFRRRIKTMTDVEGVQLDYDNTVTRDIVGTIHQVATRSASEWVVMEAAERRRFGITFQNPLGWLQDHLACNLAVFKDAGVRYIRQILVYPEPGPHDSLVVTTADHLAQIHNAQLNFVCFEADDEDTVNKQAAADYTNELRGLCLSPTEVVILKGADELKSIQEATGGYDLLVMGAAPNRKLKARLWGSPKDNLTRHAECSVLWVKTAMQKPHVAFDVAKLPDDKEVDLLSFVDEKCILLNTDVTKKELLFRKATDLLAPRYQAISPIIITTALWEREQSQNTAVGGGWALPHATLAQAANSNSAIAIMTTKRPINYGTATGEKVDVFFFTTGSPNNRQTHLRILAEISKLCQQTDFLEQARRATSNSEIMESLRNCLRASPSA